MKCRWLGLCVVIVLLAVPAQAEKPFDESSLLGTYAFTEIHTREGDISEVPIAHCSGFGTITFEGNGQGWLLGSERCSDGPDNPPENDFPIFYDMGTEPFFYVRVTPTDPNPTQCQLLQKGTIIICDGTMRDFDHYSFHLVGVKQ